MIGTADGRGVRWFRIHAAGGGDVELTGTEAVFDLDYGLPEATTLSFDGPRLQIPSEDFTQCDGVLMLEGSTRLVANARPR